MARGKPKGSSKAAEAVYARIAEIDSVERQERRAEAEREAAAPFGSWETCDETDAQRLMDKLAVIERKLDDLSEGN